jgi:hypothetical protein
MCDKEKDKKMQRRKPEPNEKTSHSTNCSLQLECMKEEWIVIGVSFAPVNMFRVLYTLPVTFWEAEAFEDVADV